MKTRIRRVSRQLELNSCWNDFSVTCIIIRSASFLLSSPDGKLADPRWLQHNVQLILVHFVWNYLWFCVDVARVNLDTARADEIRVKLTSSKGGVCAAKSDFLNKQKILKFRFGNKNFTMTFNVSSEMVQIEFCYTCELISHPYNVSFRFASRKSDGSRMICGRLNSRRSQNCQPTLKSNWNHCSLLSGVRKFTHSICIHTSRRDWEKRLRRWIN